MSVAEAVRRASGLGALMIVFTGAAACVSSPMGPTRFAPFSQSDLRAGTGPGIVTGNVVTVHYTGWFFDETRPEQKGAVFESSLTTEPLQIPVGSSSLIAGWNQGLPGLQVGGLRRLVIPPSLAYGGFRTGPVPPWTTLIFEIELISIDQ